MGVVIDIAILAVDDQSRLMASAVKEWLSGLGLGQYGEAFIDNGYDEMGMCHALNNDDIDAIGVDSPDDRQTILEASKALTEKAAAPGAMYFELEAESQTVKEKNQCAVPVYMELEAEQTVKIPRLRLKIMIREEMKRDDVDLAEEPYSNPVSVFVCCSNASFRLWL